MDIQSFTGKQWDLIVAGGGMTGVAAAVAARRGGMKEVLILEKAGYFGGAAATSLVNPFMPYTTMAGDQKLILSQGLFQEFKKEFYAIGAQEKGREELLHEEYVKAAFDRIVRKEGIQPLFHAVLCGVERRNGKVKSVSVATKAGVLTFKAGYFIDCTGDADLAFQAGCPFHVGRGDGLCQPMTLCFRVGNVDMKLYRDPKNREYMQQKYKEFREQGKITNPREDVLIFDTLVDGVLHFNSTRIVKHDPTNPFDVTEAEMMGREQMLELFHFLKENIPAFRNSQLLYSGSEIGARESRMIIGEYVLTQEDLKACTVFPDAIAAGNYDIDIHNPEGTGTSHYYFPAGQYYTIPYRSLQPKDVSNMLVAGRCISSTHEAQASYRVMPIVTTLGEAAGTAAAIAWSHQCGVKEIRISELQDTLRKNGAFLG